MGVLIPVVAALSALGACYSPALRDCTVSCEDSSDCASGQVCGDDGLCAGPDVAGRCREPGQPDAGLPPDAGGSDASPDDDDDDDDDVALLRLQVQITGKGRVILDGRGACSSEEPQEGQCMYDIPLGVPQRAHAVPLKRDERFLGWASDTCRGQLTTCTFTLLEPTNIIAQFGKTGPQ